MVQSHVHATRRNACKALSNTTNFELYGKMLDDIDWLYADEKRLAVNV